MILRYTMNGNLTVPDGTTLSESGHEFVLPCGTVCKLWEAVEDVTNENDHDLAEDERNELGIYTDLDFHREMELLP